MRIFLSYSSNDREWVEPVALALNGRGHDVFFDREDLPPGEEYDERIRRAIQKSHLFISFVSPDSVERGSYARAELEIARKNWPHPKGRMLPVVLRETAFDQMPAYLSAVTVLKPQGNVTAEVADEVERIVRGRRRRIVLYGIAGGVALTVIGVGFFLHRQASPGITGKDGALALPVPEGVFVMGDDEDWPRREVFLRPFHIDQYEVTVSRFAKFAGGWAKHQGWDEAALKKFADYPVTGVTWREADAYCRWAGKRLPTSAEWEKAARGSDERVYPWGNDAPAEALATFAKDYDKSAYGEGLSVVGGHEAGKSPSGIYDMAGNVSEWVADWYAESYNLEVSNPKGPESGESKVIRGGGWFDPADRIRSAKRWHAPPDTTADDIGFRCALDSPR